MKKCNVIGCNDKHYCKGLCQRHYMQQRRGAMNDPVKDINAIIEQLRQYEDMIHNGIKHKNSDLSSLFSLIESLIK